MRRLRLVKGTSAASRAERGFEREERFRFPPEEVWEVSCESSLIANESHEDRRRPALSGDNAHRAG
jgi:hypothetical protein